MLIPLKAKSMAHNKWQTTNRLASPGLQAPSTKTDSTLHTKDPAGWTVSLPTRKIKTIKLGRASLSGDDDVFKDTMAHQIL